MKKRLTTKSRDNKSDFTSGHASKPYMSEGKHLLDNNCKTTSSFATLPTFPKIAFAERLLLIFDYFNVPFYSNYYYYSYVTYN